MARMGREGFPEEVKRHFFAAYPRDFLEDVVRMLFLRYPSTDEECRDKHEEPEARDVYPYERRAVIEGELRRIAKSHGISATTEKNCRKSHSYTLLQSDGVLLTASAVDNPNKIPRPAEHRKTYARSAMLKLFGEQPPQSDTLYAILQHGSDPLDRAQLGFADIVFPDESYSRPATRIPLLDEFKDLVDSLRSVRWEGVASEPPIRLRSDIKRGEGTED